MNEKLSDYDYALSNHFYRHSFLKLKKSKRKSVSAERALNKSQKCTSVSNLDVLVILNLNNHFSTVTSFFRRHIVLVLSIQMKEKNSSSLN